MTLTVLKNIYICSDNLLAYLFCNSNRPSFLLHRSKDSTAKAWGFLFLCKTFWSEVSYRMGLSHADFITIADRDIRLKKSYIPMKTKITKTVTVLLLALATLTVNSCKKKTEEQPAPAKQPITYDVMFKVTLSGATISNNINLPDNDVSHYQSLVNVADGYTHHIVGKTGDAVVFSGTNSSSPGYNSILLEIYLNGNLQKAATDNKIAPAYSTAEADLVLP